MWTGTRRTRPPSRNSRRAANWVAVATVGPVRLNNVLEQDHRFVKKRIAASLWFRSVDGALRTIQGYEAMNMIRKGQVSWLAKGDIVGQVRFIERMFGLAA